GVRTPSRNSEGGGRCRRNDEPIPVRGSPHSYVRDLITVIIRWHWHVSACPPLLDNRSARIAARDDEPRAVRRPKHRKIRLPIPIVIPRHWIVSACPPLLEDRSPWLAAWHN